MIYAGILIITFILFAIINFFSKNKKPLKRAFVNMLIGVFSLVIINVAGIFWDIGLGVSPFSLTVSASLGVPGVVAMVLIKTLL